MGAVAVERNRGPSPAGDPAGSRRARRHHSLVMRCVTLGRWGRVLVVMAGLAACVQPVLAGPPAVAAPSCDPPPRAAFSDVAAGTVLADAVDWSACHQVIPGFPGGLTGGRFRPAASITRQVWVRGVWVLAGSPAPVGAPAVFTDVRAGSAYKSAIDWASSVGVVPAAADGLFGPTGTVSRGTAAVWAFRALSGGDMPPADVRVAPFSDVTVAERADAAVWAASTGVLAGYADGTFRPDGLVSRGCAVKMLWRAAGTPAAWEQTFAGAVVLGSAVGWWDTAGWDGSGGKVPDLSGQGHPMTMAAGDVGGPTRLGYDADYRPYLFHPGWDDMILDTPDTARFPTGSFDFRIDGDLTRELSTNASAHNFVFHKGAGTDSSLAVSYHGTTGAPTVWFSADGTSWETMTGPAPSFGVAAGRRGIRFVADDGDGGHRAEFYAQPASLPAGDIDLPFGDPAWQLTSTVTAPGVVAIHDSAREAAMSSGVDRIPDSGAALAAGWGRIRRMTLTAVNGGTAAPAFDLNPSTVRLPLTWVRSGPIPGAQPCWCMPGDTRGPAKDGSFTDPSFAEWTIHNWQTGSTPIAIVDRPAVLFGNNAHLTAGPSPLFDPGPAGLTVALGFRWTRSGISGSFMYSHRAGTLNHDTPGWDSITTGFLCCGPGFNAGDGTTNVYATSPIEPDGVPTSTIGVYDRGAGTATAYTGGRAGTPVPAPTAAGFGVSPAGQLFSVGADVDPDLHSYGGYEFFAAAVFSRPLSSAEVDAVDAYMADPARVPGVNGVPAPIRFA